MSCRISTLVVRKCNCSVEVWHACSRLWQLNMCHQSGYLPHSFEGSFFSGNHQKPKGTSRLWKITMTEKNGESTPRIRFSCITRLRVTQKKRKCRKQAFAGGGPFGCLRVRSYSSLSESLDFKTVSEYHLSGKQKVETCLANPLRK